MAFADHYTLDAFASIADASWWRSSDLDGGGGRTAGTPEQRKTASEMDGRDRARLDKHKDEVFNVAVRAHLDGLRDAGALAPTGGLAGRDVWQATAWNDYLTGKPDDHHTKWLVDAIGQGVFTRTFVRMDDTRHSTDREPGVHVPPAPDRVEAAWRTICEALDGGTSGDQHMGWGLEAQDCETGDRCTLVFEGWKATLMRRNARHDLEPAEDVGEIPLSAAPIPVPTGKLLLTDYLRVEGIKEAIEFDDREYREMSLNSTKGQAARTFAHATEHGMGYCQTENTYLNVFASDADGSLAFMPSRQETMKGWSKAGSISCDVWRITILDRSTAIALAAKGGNAEAEAEVDRYLALASAPDVWSGEGEWADHAQAHHDQCYSRNVVRLDVTPGTWTLHCGPDFHKRVDRKALGLPRGAKPWAVLKAPAAA